MLELLFVYNPHLVDQRWEAHPPRIKLKRLSSLSFGIGLDVCLLDLQDLSKKLRTALHLQARMTLIIIPSITELACRLMRYNFIHWLMSLSKNLNKPFTCTWAILSHVFLKILINKWGGISSEEHDEAVMLEAAMFGGIPEGAGYNFTYAPHQFMQAQGHYPGRVPDPPSPSLEAQRLIREQQVFFCPD